MKSGKMLKFGDVILAEIQFTDTFETKKRPAVVLFEEFFGHFAVNADWSGINFHHSNKILILLDLNISKVFIL